MRGYMAIPAKARGRQPAVIVIHENRGLTEHIRDVTRRVALAGHVALAPDFLSGAGGTPADENAARALIGKLDLAESVADAAATAMDPKSLLASRLSPGRRERLMVRLREGSEQAFLDGYREIAGDVPQPLLDFFLIEKAAYEIGYEAANRPAWLALPLSGLARIAERLLKGSRP